VGQRVAAVLGMSKLDTAGSFINESLDSTQVIPEAKTELAKSLANSDGGARMLLARAKAGSLPPGARLLVGARLRASGNAEIRSAAQELFPAPAGAAKQPLPPVSELISKSGDAQRGLEVFKLKGTCANCHIVNGSGKNVGPDLSEIGGKLSREAMLVAILDPSAGISHNFENYAALTTSGQVVNGLLVSRTDAKVVLKDAQGIERTVTAEELEQFKKLDKSLMPDNLHENLTADELVDLMEYLMSLRKKQ
jgi:putative heme-binding domain-containing protein